MLELFYDAVASFVLSFIFIYTAVFVFDAVFVSEKEEPFSFEGFIQKIRNKL